MMLLKIENENLQETLENLVKKYENEEFIKDDPIQFPHRYFKRQDVEISAFIASLLAYGNRKIFISELNKIFNSMRNPTDYIKNFKPFQLKGFNYRFTKEVDLVQVFLILQEIYSKNSSLNEIFKMGFEKNRNIQDGLQSIVDYFYARVTLKVSSGFYHLLPSPKNGGACKRLNMFLRWVVRKSVVDFGIWDFVSPSELLIPLDVHVARISRQIGLLERKTNDFRAVVELTQNLKKLDKNDPLKYDFAMFGFGVNN